MNTLHIAQVEKVSLRAQVTGALRAAIISGEMEPGMVYSAPTLGAQFGVSATPVREAMLDLAREGLVTILPNKGFRVTDVDDADLDRITQLRLLVEPPVVRDVTPLIPAADLPGLRARAQLIVDAAEAGDLFHYTEADRAFHLALLGYADNPRITDLIGDLRSQTRLIGLASLLERGELAESAREHLRIVDVIESRDVEAVYALMRTHIGHTRGKWARVDASAAAGI
ncbi:MAG: putative GntR family transcriptional regulator [Friedmanniella sp.]|nr:putative GntR family transcriptional regulator [Friedmanniella sp.]